MVAAPEGDQDGPKDAEEDQGARPGTLRHSLEDCGPLRESADGGPEPNAACPRCGARFFTAGPPDDTPCAACLTPDEQEVL